MAVLLHVAKSIITDVFILPCKCVELCGGKNTEYSFQLFYHLLVVSQGLVRNSLEGQARASFLETTGVGSKIQVPEHKVAPPVLGSKVMAPFFLKCTGSHSDPRPT